MTDLPWMTEAKRMMGVVEVKGEANHPELEAMAAALRIFNFQDDVDPWCTMFVSHCIQVGIPDVPLPKHLVWSRAYQKWGVELKEPIYGAIVVLWRGKDIKLDLGHCCFFTRPHPRASKLFFGIGGNQSNMVSEAAHLREKIVPHGIRWPHGIPLPEGAQVA